MYFGSTNNSGFVYSYSFNCNKTKQFGGMFLDRRQTQMFFFIINTPSCLLIESSLSSFVCLHRSSIFSSFSFLAVFFLMET